MTRRDLQIKNRDQGGPGRLVRCLMMRSFSVHLVEDTGYLTEGPIELLINGETRQQGDLNQMIHDPVALICYLSTLQTLHAGDLIFTRPSGCVGHSRATD